VRFGITQSCIHFFLPLSGFLDEWLIGLLSQTSGARNSLRSFKINEFKPLLHFKKHQIHSILVKPSAAFFPF
jgi:hypothetical protein